MPKDKIGQAKKFLDNINPMKKVTEAMLKAKATHFTTLAAAFGHKNPETLMILLDPKTDVFFMSYDKYQVPLLMKDADNEKMNAVKGAMLFNADTLDHSTELNFLLGTISSALNSMRALREQRISKEKRQYKKVDMRPAKYKEREKIAKKDAKLREKIDKAKKMKARIKAEDEQEDIAREQKKLDDKN